MDAEIEQRVRTMLERAKRELRREYRGRIDALEARIADLEQAASPHKLQGD